MYSLYEQGFRPLSHKETARVCLSIFQVGPIGPPIVLYGETDVNGHVSVYTCLHPIQSAKNRQMGIPFPIHLVDRIRWHQMEMDRRSVSIRLPHRDQRAVSMSALHQRGSADRSPAEQADLRFQSPLHVKGVLPGVAGPLVVQGRSSPAGCRTHTFV